MAPGGISNGRSRANIQRAPCGAIVIRCRIVLPLGDCLGKREIDAGASGARHSIPSQRHITSPRQYMGPGGGVLLPGNSARKAMSEEFASAAMLPGESRSEKPELAERMARNSNRKLVLIRGNKRNKRITSGAA